MRNNGKERYTNVLYSKISYNKKLFRNSKYFYIFNPTCTIVKLLARNNIMPDVDIDFYDRDNTLKLFKHAPASIIRNDKIEKHLGTHLSLNKFLYLNHQYLYHSI